MPDNPPDGYSFSKDDLETWQHVAKTVKPIPGKEIKPSEPKKKIEIEKKERPNLTQLVQEIESPDPKKNELNYIKHGEITGIDKSTANKLKAGKLKIEATLDMHGRNQDEALEGLRYFIRTSFEMKKRCVLIITGKGEKGEGVLKKQVPRWMNVTGIREYILIFSYATAKHGGDGALYVLLKRNKN